MEDERFMKMALGEARAAAAEGEVPVGAVVVCHGRVIARAHNLTETLTDVTAHAEMQAIRLRLLLAESILRIARSTSRWNRA